MPDLTDHLRRSVDGAVASFEPSADLPQRIARRTLQLQRRRRGRVVGGAALFAVAMLALPLVLGTMGGSSTAVSVGWTPVNVTAAPPRTTTTTTVGANLWALPDLKGLAALNAKLRNNALKKFAAAIKKHERDQSNGTAAADGAQVLDANISRGSAPNNPAPRHTTSTTRKGTTTTTKKPPTTTTTKKPPPTTLPTVPPTTIPIVPLQIVAPDHVCAGVPATFSATGTGADLVVWSNGQVGATATFVLTESASITATLDLGGSVSRQAYGVQAIPAGTPPC
jgi:cell division septation protein DedD